MSRIVTILLVDDNEVSRLTCGRFLQHNGYLIVEAEDGHSALDQLERVDPDLIILDVMMPGLSGFDVLERIRRDRPQESLPVIMVTARDTATDVVRAFEFGANDYVTKPVDFPVLLARIKAQLRSRLALNPGVREHQRAEAQRSRIGPGTVLEGRYRLESSIGKGYFGEVYHATQLALDRPVAVKLLNFDVEPESDVMERFRQEGITACRIDHPNAVAVLDLSFTSTGVPYLVMELLKGHNLHEELKGKGRLPPARCMEILAPICRVLSRGHGMGIIHRDIKPPNIFMHQSRLGEIVKVVDFGIAKLVGETAAAGSCESQVVGTPMYMAPERLSGEPSDGRTDVYSVGVMLYEMLSGRPPFRDPRGAAFKVIKMHLTEPPPSLSSLCPDLPRGVVSVVHEALEKNPDDRPPAAQLAISFAAALGLEPPGLADLKSEPYL